MAPRTKAHPDETDHYGIERSHSDDTGAVDKVRERSPFIDHVMRMTERYGSNGGNQYAAGITYYSVLAMFPILMLVVATAATVLARNPDLFNQLQDKVTSAFSGDLGDAINSILETAIDQRGAMFGIGGLTALWSGLGWMNNLRVGISAMWNVDANEGGSFIKKKLSDLVGLIGLLIALAIAFGVTIAGTSGLLQKIFHWVGVDSFPGMGAVIFFAGLVIGLVANFLVMLWLIKMLPRTHVPMKAAVKGALLGAIVFELIKQFSTLFISSASSNTAGATFGPSIVLMITLYLVWRVVLYSSAWAATAKESMVEENPETPGPAIIRVRQEAAAGGRATAGSNTGVTLGVGAALGALGAGAFSLLRRKK